MVFPTKYRKVPYRLLAIYVLLSVGFLIAGYQHYRHQKEYITKERQEALAAIADLKLRQIVNWRSERLGDAASIYENRLIIPHIQRFLESPGASPDAKEIATWLEAIQKTYSYKSILLLDKEGNIRLKAPAGPETLGPDAKRLAAEAVRTRKIIFSDLYRSKIRSVIRLTLVVPLFPSHSHGAPPVGVLLLRVDPFRLLYPLIQTWPTPSKTAETLLVRRDGNEVLFLNALRHKDDSALNLRLSVGKKSLPAAMAVRGTEGVVEGIDYRGIPVLAVLRAVPDSPWFLEAKVDQEEIYAPIRQYFWIVTIIVGLLIIGSGMSMGVVWRSQLNEELEERVLQRTQQLEATNKELEREVSERRIAEETLHKSEERFRNLVETARDVIFTLSTNGMITSLNIAFESITGWTRTEWVGKSMVSLIHPQDLMLAFDKLNKTLRGEHMPLFELRIATKSGTFKTGEFLARPQLADGKVVGIFGIARDITERKLAIEKLREAEIRYRTLFEESPEGVLLIDPESTLPIEFNEAAHKQLGYSREEFTGLKTSDYEVSENVEETRKRISEILLEGRGDFETRHRTKQGEVRNVLVTIRLMDLFNKPFLHCIYRDITEIRRSAEEIKRLNEDLRQRAVELEAVNKELEAFSYSVSHDLRAPLRGMDGFSQALLEDYGDLLDEQGRDYLSRVRGAGQRMAQLIDDLLDLSRVTRRDMQRDKVDMSSLAETIAGELKESHPDRKVEFVIRKGMAVSGDERLLNILLANLLGNAFKFTEKIPLARIEFGIIEGDEPTYFVRDNGAGFDMIYSNKLFGAFQRLHAQAEFPGTGIGLAIVQRIVRRHGGRVWGEGAVGKGATFYFTL